MIKKFYEFILEYNSGNVSLVNSQNFNDYKNLLVLTKDLGEEFIGDIKNYCGLEESKYPNHPLPDSDDWKVFVIKYEEIICGVIGFYRLDNSNEYWIAWFGILKEYRSKNIGSKSLNELIKIIKSENINSSLYVYVEDDNYPAISFYKKNGMKIVSSVDDFCISRGYNKEDYFTTSSEDIVMVKKL